MKPNIHPKYYQDAKVTCACGNKFETGSTLPEITVEICSACHPFFTGEMKFVDSQGRVEKFEGLRQKAAKIQKQIQSKKEKQNLQDKQDQEGPRTLKEMMQSVAKHADKDHPDS